MYIIHFILCKFLELYNSTGTHLIIQICIEFLNKDTENEIVFSIFFKPDMDKAFN